MATTDQPLEIVYALKKSKRLKHNLGGQFTMILDLKCDYPNWGAPKIREKIVKKYPDVKAPAKSMVHANDPFGFQKV